MTYVDTSLGCELILHDIIFNWKADVKQNLKHFYKK